MKTKIQRCDKGYLTWKRKRELIKTILFFAIPLALFIAGYITTQSRLNLLTIVAVLGMLPASRSLVTLIMYLKGHGISEEDYAVISPLADTLTGSYDNIFTTYERAYEVPSLVVRSGNVCGYSYGDPKNLGTLEKHLATSIKKEGYSVNVKIFESTDAYVGRLESLNKLQETQQEKDLAIRQILFDISL